MRESNNIRKIPTENKIAILICILIAIVLCILLPDYFAGRECDLTKFNEGKTTSIGEITSDTEIIQTIPKLFDHITGITLCFANYSNRPNAGTVYLQVVDGERVVANKELDASKIGDWDNITLNFSKHVNKNNSPLKLIIKSSSRQGSAVTLWMTQNKVIDSADGILTVNGKATENSLNMSIRYRCITLNGWFCAVLLFVFCILHFAGVPHKFLEKYKNSAEFKKRINNLIFIFGLLIVAFMLLCLRNLTFLTDPKFYGEDGTFMSQILRSGLFKSMFSARDVTRADFSNSGSFLLLYLALKTTTLFHGYDLSMLPTWIGVFGNLFWAATALLVYKAFRNYLGRTASIAAFLAVILIPIGSAGNEVFGRILNTQFLWPVTVAAALLCQYKNKHSHIVNLLIGLLCILAGISFPVCYAVIGVYLLVSFIRAAKLRSIRGWLGDNFLELAALAIGIYLLPSLLQSKGATIGMITNPDMIFEFVIARHILYPFIFTFYTHLNDKLACLIFLMYGTCVLVAGWILFKKDKKRFWGYTLFVLIAIMVCFGSAFMRLGFTSLFHYYQSTFPDRYFYGCNMLSVLVIVWASAEIIMQFVTSKISGAAYKIIMALLIGSFVANPYMFESTHPAADVCVKYVGSFAECVRNAVDERVYDEGGYVLVQTYPNNGIFKIEIPIKYAIVTATQYTSSH